MSDDTRAWKDQYMLRLPDGMRDRLKDEAAKNNRSMNAEIVSRLETTFEMDSYVPSKNAHPDAGAMNALTTSPELLKTLVDEIVALREQLAKRD